MNYKLRIIKKEMEAMRIKNYPVFSHDDIQELCSYLSEKAKKDILDNGYKDGNLIYKNLKTETLIEIADIK